MESSAFCASRGVIRLGLSIWSRIVSISQLISGYVFHSTRALTQLAVNDPERHGARALNVISIKNEAALAKLERVEEKLDSAERKLEKAYETYRFQIDYARYHANDVALTHGGARAHSDNLETVRSEVRPREWAVGAQRDKKMHLTDSLQKYSQALETVRGAMGQLGDNGVRNIESLSLLKH